MLEKGRRARSWISQKILQLSRRCQEEWPVRWAGAPPSHASSASCGDSGTRSSPGSH